MFKNVKITQLSVGNMYKRDHFISYVHTCSHLVTYVYIYMFTHFLSMFSLDHFPQPARRSCHAGVDRPAPRYVAMPGAWHMFEEWQDIGWPVYNSKVFRQIFFLWNLLQRSFMCLFELKLKLLLVGSSIGMMIPNINGPSEKYEFVNWDDNRNPILMGK